MYHIRANDARVKDDVASIVDEESRELHLESGRITKGLQAATTKDSQDQISIKPH